MEIWMVMMGVAVGVSLLALALVWVPLRSAWRESRFARCRKDFHRQREWLEAKFLDLAASSGKPRGLRWTNCDFDDDVAYARDRRNGDLLAFVGVTIAFEAIPGGPMEDVEAVGNLREATAVFRCVRGRWQTDGRAMFNLSPTEAIAYYHREIEIVGREFAHRS